MKILVCLKQVPDTTKVKLSGDYTLERNFVAQVMNPADESALELGLLLRDQHGGNVTALSMGPRRCESMLRDALARGADKAVLLSDPAFSGADTLVTAKCLSAAIRVLGGFDLILCGRRAIDGDTGQVGPMVAALLDIPCVVHATEVNRDGDHLLISQLTEQGRRIWKTPLPAVVTLCEWCYLLRLPGLLSLKRSAKAEVPVLKPEDIGLSATDCGLKASPTRVIRIDASPIGARPCRKLNVDEVLAELTRRGILQ